MAVDLQPDAGGKILVIKLTGKLTKEDYEHFVPTRVVCVTSQHPGCRRPIAAVP